MDVFRKYPGKKPPATPNEAAPSRKSTSAEKDPPPNHRQHVAGGNPRVRRDTDSPPSPSRSSLASYVTATEDAPKEFESVRPSTSPGRTTLASAPYDSVEKAQQVSLRKAMAELKKPAPDPAKAKGALRNLKAMFKSSKLPTPFIALDASEAAARENHRAISAARLQSGKGITEVRVAGTIGLDDDGSALLRSLLEPSAQPAGLAPLRVRKKDGKAVVDVASIDMHHVKKMASQDQFDMFILRLSTPGAVFISLKNDEGCCIDASSTEKKRGNVNLRLEDGAKAKAKAQDLAKVSGATALALRCLRAQEFALFAQIAAIVPEVVVEEICTLPFAGNIFTAEAVVHLFRALTPSATVDGHLLQDRPENKEALSLCINHFLRYSPVKGLTTSIRKPLQMSRESSKNSDLLIQHQYWFLHEIVDLRRRLLTVDITDLSKTEVSIITAQAVWQTAEMMGNTFKYMQNTAADFGAARKELTGHIEKTLTIMKTMAGAGLGNSPAPSGISDVAGLSADTVGELLSKWAVKTGSEFNITELATQLAFVSDSLKTKSQMGLLVPGYQEVAMLNTSADGTQSEENKQRLRNGPDFNDKYSTQLAKFKEHYLERTIKAEAEVLD